MSLFPAYGHTGEHPESGHDDGIVGAKTEEEDWAENPSYRLKVPDRLEEEQQLSGWDSSSSSEIEPKWRKTDSDATLKRNERRGRHRRDPGRSSPSSSPPRSHHRNKERKSKTRSRKGQASPPTSHFDAGKKVSRKKARKGKDPLKDAGLPVFGYFQSFEDDFGEEDRKSFGFGLDRRGDVDLCFVKTGSNSNKELPDRKVARYRCRWTEDIMGASMHFRRILDFKDRKSKEDRRYIASRRKKRLLDHPDQQLEKLMPSGGACTLDLTTNRIKLGGGQERDLKKIDEVSPPSISRLDKVRDFNERLRISPENVELWKEYLDFQDIEDDSQGSIKVKNKALVERKLSILRTAMEKNPGSADLAIERLRLSAEIHDHQTLDTQWRELLNLFEFHRETLEATLKVWDGYLVFVASNFPSFKAGKLIAAAGDFFSRLKRARRTVQGCRKSEVQVLKAMAAIQLTVASHWCQTGLRERAVALFQSLMELNFFSSTFQPFSRSGGADGLVDPMMAFFEQFWDSGATRIGEAGKSTTSAQKPPPPTLGPWPLRRSLTMKASLHEGLEEDAGDGYRDPNDDQAEAEAINKALKGQQQLDLVRLWVDLEFGRERRHWSPWRSSEEEPEDPDRSVQFDDISDFLFRFPRTMEDDDLVWESLMLKLFVGFSEVVFEEDSRSSANNGLFADTFDDLTRTHAFRSWAFMSADCGHLVTSGRDVFRALQGPDAKLQDFFRTAQLQIILTPNQEGGKSRSEDRFRTRLLGRWLASEVARIKRLSGSSSSSTAKMGTKALKETVMSVAAQDKDNLEVYCLFGLALSSLEGVKAGRSVLDKVLKSFSADQGQNQNQQQQRLLALIYAVINEISRGPAHLQAQDALVRTLELLVMAACSSSVTLGQGCSREAMAQAEVLNAAQIEKTLPHEACDTFDDLIQGGALLSHPRLSECLQRVFIQTWLLYLSMDLDLTVPSDYLTSILRSTQKNRVFQEMVAKLYSDLLLFDLARTDLVGRPALGRAKALLGSSLEEFPANAYFLHEVILGRLREDSVTSVTVVADPQWRKIYATLTRSPLTSAHLIEMLIRANDESSGSSSSSSDSSNIFRAQHLLRRALLDDTGARPSSASLAMWRRYFWTCWKLGQPLEKIKSLFYRALQDFPGAKVLYLDIVRLYVSRDEAAFDLEFSKSRRRAPLAEEEGQPAAIMEDEEEAEEEDSVSLRDKVLQSLQVEVQELMVEKGVRIRMPMEELKVMLEPEEASDGEEENG